jgi:hypothetical protein
VVRKTPDPEVTGSLRDQATDSCRKPNTIRGTKKMKRARPVAAAFIPRGGQILDTTVS